MATEWHKVHDSRDARPPELDTTSSAYKVYLRKNIQQETVHDDMAEEDYQQWVYDQMEYTREEYETLTGPATGAIMQGQSDITADVLLGILTDSSDVQKTVMQAINDQTADLTEAMISMMGV